MRRREKGSVKTRQNGRLMPMTTKPARRDEGEKEGSSRERKIFRRDDSSETRQNAPVPSNKKIGQHTAIFFSSLPSASLLGSGECGRYTKQSKRNTGKGRVDIGKGRQRKTKKGRQRKEGWRSIPTKGKERNRGKDRREEGRKESRKNHLHYKSAFLAWCCGV